MPSLGCVTGDRPAALSRAPILSAASRRSASGIARPAFFVGLQRDQQVGASGRKEEQPRNRDVEAQVVVHSAAPRMPCSHRLTAWGSDSLRGLA